MTMSSDLTLGEKLNRMSGIVDKPAHAAKKPNEMDKEAFMKMLMQQIKYQDPFNPVKNEQFAAHLTAMSQLEQAVNTNQQLEKLVSQGSNSQVAALQVVGKNIVANKATVYHDQEKATDVMFDLPQAASEVSVVVRDGTGQEIRTIELGAQAMGKVEAKWDGFTDNQMQVPKGRYAYVVRAKDAAGKEIEVKTKVEGKVTGVTSFNGETYLLVGTEKVGLSDIESINLPESDQKTDKTQVASASASTTPKSVNTPTEAKEAVGTENEIKNIGGSETSKKLESLLPLIYR